MAAQTASKLKCSISQLGDRFEVKFVRLVLYSSGQGIPFSQFYFSEKTKWPSIFKMAAQTAS